MLNTSKLIGALLILAAFCAGGEGSQGRERRQRRRARRRLRRLIRREVRRQIRRALRRRNRAEE
jgi:hypothetical protein